MTEIFIKVSLRDYTMERKQAYHGESCRGMVSVNFWVEADKVQACFCDGDISSSSVEYSVERTNKGEYRVVEREQLSTPLDSSWGKNAPEIKSQRVRADTKEEALKAMIDFIVKPYVNPSKHSFPVNAAKLRKGLEKALLEETAKRA